MNLVETAYKLNDKSKHVGKITSAENATLTNIQLRAGEEINEHDSKNVAFIIVRRGKVRFTIEGEEVFVTPENVLQMAPLEKHSLHALEDTDLVLIQVKP